jgi:homoserine dehydrogenase
MTAPKRLRVGVAGLGVVGGGLLDLAARKDGQLAQAIEIVGVSARSRSRARSVDISGLPWFDSPSDLAALEGLDVLVELMGGSDGPAKHAVETALRRGVAVVTANKALLAEHGAELATLAEQNRAALRYEAAVAGGVPVIKVLREGLSANQVTAVAGVLNGTCNYILTRMEASGASFGDVLADAQRLGYAEADPTFDVGGFDAGHKLSILAALCFGGAPSFRAVRIEGISALEPVDIAAARDLGRRIKLVGRARLVDDRLEQVVRPELLARDHPLAGLEGALNAVMIDAAPVGRLTLVGPGAGAGPTASAVAADLIDLAHGGVRPVFASAHSRFVSRPVADEGGQGRFYVRLRVKDRPGVIAAVSDVLAHHGVSIETFSQKAVEDASRVPIVLTTQAVAEKELRTALAEIAGLEAVVELPCLIKIDA